MTGETILMDGSKCLYHIPDYQREYAWGTKDSANRAGGPEVSEFWQDIYERCWVLGKNHFIGTILCSQSTLNGQPCFDIVDGQQRITTLFVLCIALRDFLEENNLANPKLTERLSDNQKEPRLVLSDRQGHDRDTLANLLLSRHEIWHLHTAIPINPAKVKGVISGILEEGKQHDPQRQQLATSWLTEHNRAASRIGEFDASLSIDSLGETIAIRVKIDVKGKIKILVPKGKSLHLG
jgi:hypothetical protein